MEPVLKAWDQGQAGQPDTAVDTICLDMTIPFPVGGTAVEWPGAEEAVVGDGSKVPVGIGDMPGKPSQPRSLPHLLQWKKGRSWSRESLA
jgi:hypothetical protein